MNPETKRLLNRLGDAEIWVVLLLSGISLIWSPVLWATLILGAVFWITRRLNTGRAARRTPADWGILLLAVICALNLFVTPNLEAARIQLLRLLNGIILYYAIVNSADSWGKIRILHYGLLFGGMALAVFSLISVEWAVTKFPFLNIDLYKKLIVLVQDSANPNVIAGSLILFIPLAAATTLFGAADPRRTGNHRMIAVIAAAAFVLMSGVLALTVSRGAMLGLAAALLAVLALRWRWGWLGAALVGGVLWVIVESIDIRPLWDLLLTSRSLVSVDERMEVWSRAVMMIRDFPFTGVGMGSFKLAVDSLYPFPPTTSGNISHAHNLYLQIAADIGLPGLIAWLSIAASMTGSIWSAYREASKRGEILAAGIAVGLLCSQIALGVHGIVDAVTWGDIRSTTFVWLVWGSIAAYAGVSPRQFIDKTPG